MVEDTMKTRLRQRSELANASPSLEPYSALLADHGRALRWYPIVLDSIMACYTQVCQTLENTIQTLEACAVFAAGADSNSVTLLPSYIY